MLDRNLIISIISNNTINQYDHPIIYRNRVIVVNDITSSIIFNNDVDLIRSIRDDPLIGIFFSRFYPYGEGYLTIFEITSKGEIPQNAISLILQTCINRLENLMTVNVKPSDAGPLWWSIMQTMIYRLNKEEFNDLVQRGPEAIAGPLDNVLPPDMIREIDFLLFSFPDYFVCKTCGDKYRIKMGAIGYNQSMIASKLSGAVFFHTLHNMVNQDIGKPKMHLTDFPKSRLRAGEDVLWTFLFYVASSVHPNLIGDDGRDLKNGNVLQTVICTFLHVVYYPNLDYSPYLNIRLNSRVELFLFVYNLYMKLYVGNEVVDIEPGDIKTLYKELLIRPDPILLTQIIEIIKHSP